MNRAATFTTILAAIATAGCASSSRTADNPSAPIGSHQNSMDMGFFEPLTMDQASQIVTMPRVASTFQPASSTAAPSPGFVSLGAGDALGIRVHLADRAIATAPISWDMTAVPTD